MIEAENRILFRGQTPDGIFAEGFYYEKCGRGYICGDAGAKGHLSQGESGTDVPERKYPGAEGAQEVIPETVRQYTGLKDFQGHRIFEGDILQYDRDGELHKGIVTYGIFNATDIGYCVAWKIGRATDTFRNDLGFWAECAHVAIKGNIHDKGRAV